MLIKKVTAIDAFVSLKSLLNQGCLVFCPIHRHHFPIIDAKLAESNFIGVYYKIENHEDIIAFDFDSIYTCKNGIYFKEQDEFKSYCLRLEEFLVGDELEKTRKAIHVNQKDKEYKKLCKKIFKNNS